jgi:hypothetical protein
MSTARFHLCPFYSLVPKTLAAGRDLELFAVVFTWRELVIHASWDEDISFNFFFRDHCVMDAERHCYMVDL